MKIISLQDFKTKRDTFRCQGNKVIHCHGVFDLLHPGHIAHFEEAKQLGDVLVISVTAAPYVNKGPGRPYFSDELRMRSLAALECVDYVVLSENETAIEIIENIKPDYYVKGKEYEDYEADITQNIEKEIAAVREYGGDVYFTDDRIVFSSTKLLNHNFEVFPPGVKEYTQDLAARYSFAEIKNIVEDLSVRKVLVVGDAVIDEYVFSSVMGLMSKDRGLSSRYLKEETYLGGALVVARHLAAFSKNVSVCTLIGQEAPIHSQMLNELSKDMFLDLCIDPFFQTTRKRRFIEKRGIRDEYDKLFSINYLMEEEQSDKVNRNVFYQKLEKTIPAFDVVIVADYGHGALDQKAMDIIQEKSNFMALNCQTNSTNFGMNLITKYDRADVFTLDQREISLACSSRSTEYPLLLARLKQRLKSRGGWLTLGSLGAMSIDADGNTTQAPALTLNVQDTVGAGDAFFAISSLCAGLELPFDIGAFFGNIAGALAANVIGNSRATNKPEFLKFLATLLNY
ncbi:MAG: adenylyltransferase/cytidyltransferase family protein [Clostridiaceae bacterium]|nr:adenylyltransferase/cytidyltransferase family protein [Clostridiaceae bacterium]